MSDLVRRLEALECLEGVPRGELEWLVEHGTYERHRAGTVLAPEGERIERLWIILSGHVAVRVDRGVGPRRVIDWREGDVTGMLPYSRMTAPPGDNTLEEDTEVIAVHERDFPEMIHRCPEFTAYTVHLMLDRARTFNASALQDEKMISLGKLAAGLAHELNNPASAAVRGADVLLDALAEADEAARALGAAGLAPDRIEALTAIRDRCAAPGAALSSMEQAELEEAIEDWLRTHGVAVDRAAGLADAGVAVDALDAIAAALPGEALDAGLRWTAAGCAVRAITRDIRIASDRIQSLVGAMKRFTYMDRRGAAEELAVEPSLRDTVRVVAAKAREKSARITVAVEPGLPPVRGIGSELNQVWLNLVDNALDAIHEGGHVEIGARRELDRVVVSVVDDGPGIPPDVLPHIFDPFFTTKAPGQGTGLGLDIAQRLVRRSSGDIEVTSVPGRTEFRVDLSAVDANPP